jgi:CDP-diacylglycerol---serine O-phosphatidyltransferase
MADMPQERHAPRHFSMLRSFALADLFTLGNVFCGTGSLLALVQYLATQEERWLWVAFSLFPVALVMDTLDGRIARWRHKSSPLGADLDSLADVISFGVGPAVLGFVLGLRGALDVPVLLYFVACGTSRLARFNVTAAALADESGKVKYFEGTPIPTSLLLVGVLAWFAWKGHTGENLPLGRLLVGELTFHPAVLMYALLGSTMISKTLRIPKF